ncbi:hypothetical protein ACQ4LE_003722 [Meloidogyne hapla]|uniref:Pept_C1 domain-containing protein n=1 Tax=Meloidogyne hapla TaxID=6305 RepID=A0A1I8AZL4_MELHA
MKKIIIIFSILLIINITTTKKYPDPLEELINGLPGDSYGVILGKLIDYLKKLLGPILPLNDAELRDLTERLRELKRVELSITSAELQNRANQVAIINKQTGGEWKAKLNLESLLPEKYQRILCGLKQVYKGSKAPRSKRASKGVTKRIVSCTYKRDFDVRDKWSCCKQIISYIPNQGFCGSCWAVATASAYTDRYCIERAKKGLITPNITRNIFSSYDL